MMVSYKKKYALMKTIFLEIFFFNFGLSFCPFLGTVVKKNKNEENKLWIFIYIFVISQQIRESQFVNFKCFPPKMFTPLGMLDTYENQHYFLQTLLWLPLYRF